MPNSLTKTLKNFLGGRKSGEWASRQIKDQTETAMGVGRRTTDSKVESNDSPETPDRGATSDIPGLLSGSRGAGQLKFELSELKMTLTMHRNIFYFIF